MKKFYSSILALIVITFFLSGCGESKKNVEIKGLVEYTDPYLNFGMKYPSNWFVQKIPSRIIAYSTNSVIKRFRNFDPDGELGVKVELDAVKLMPGQTIDSVIDKKQFTRDTYSNPQKVKVGGVDGVKQTYAFPLSDGAFDGEIYYIQGDPDYVTVVDFEAFGGTLQNYRKDLDEILASVKLARAAKATNDTIKEIKELPPPSDKLTSSMGDGFSIMIPDNFTVNSPKVNGALKSYHYIGERRADCDMRVDIIDASKQNNLDKIAEQNKANQGNATPKATTLGGLKAYEFEYSPAPNVMSRVYYVVKNQKCFRVTMNWFKGEEQSYKPIFEKSIGSIKFN